MPQTAPTLTPEQLVSDYLLYAHKIAHRWGERWPHLLHDFDSAAVFTLWEVATKFDPNHGPKFSAYFRTHARWSMIRVLANERRKSPPSFDAQFAPAEGNDLSPLDTAPSREPDPAEAAEVADVPSLLDRLPPPRRARLLRRFSGTTADELAEELGLTPAAVRMQLAADLNELRTIAVIRD